MLATSSEKVNDPCETSVLPSAERHSAPAQVLRTEGTPARRWAILEWCFAGWYAPRRAEGGNKKGHERHPTPEHEGLFPQKQHRFRN